jgi:hypothetical protein
MSKGTRCVIAFIACGLLASVGTLAAIAPSSAPASTGPPKTLRVTDTSGNVLTIKLQDGSFAWIDYTNYAFFYTEDHEHNGIRIKQGEAIVTVPWERLKKVDVIKGEESGAEAQIITVSGETRPVVLVKWSEKGLNGESEFGSLSIQFYKIKTIEVLR